MRRNRLLDRFLEKIPADRYEKVKKSMTCAYLVNGDECKIGSHCNPEKCKEWKLHEDFEDDTRGVQQKNR